MASVFCSFSSTIEVIWIKFKEGFPRTRDPQVLTLFWGTSLVTDSIIPVFMGSTLVFVFLFFLLPTPSLVRFIHINP